MPADLLLINGRFKTMNPTQPFAEAVAIRNGRIAAVGSNAEAREAAGSRAQSIDLTGRTATPGLNDAHSHPMGLGASLLDLNLRRPNVTTIAEIVTKVQERAAATPAGKPVLGRGYDQAQLDDQRHPTRHDIDPVAVNQPVFLLRACHHIAVANSYLLNLAGIDRNTPDPDGGTIDRDEHGEPTGVLRESAMNLVRAHMPAPTTDEIAAAIRAGHQAFLETGVTSTIEAGIRRIEEMHAYQQLRQSGEIKVRTYLMMMIDEMLDHMIGLGLQTGFGDDRLRIGSAKLFSDGSLGGRTARMKAPYEGEPDNHGLWMEEPTVMKEKILKAHNAGFQVAIHAIGDDAVDVILQGYEEAIAKSPRADTRHRIEHALLVSEDVLVRMKAAGVVPIPGTSFNYFFAPAYAQNVGEERLRYSNAMASFKAHGIVAAASTDAPVVVPTASIGLYGMVTRKDVNGDVVWGEQAISLDDALRAYTWAGAYASFEEGIKGSLEPGKLGDIAVFETNLDALAPDDLKEVKIDLTISEGEVVYER
ncbi:MAG: amidohydrolase [Thermomicrobiales bacterium]|nr:amidohydrolase [Thermomicrobiales bacterium]